MSMIVQPDNAREAISLPVLARDPGFPAGMTSSEHDIASHPS
jgi:hypothetical protein